MIFSDTLLTNASQILNIFQHRPYPKTAERHQISYLQSNHLEALTEWLVEWNSERICFNLSRKTQN